MKTHRAVGSSPFQVSPPSMSIMHSLHRLTWLLLLPWTVAVGGCTQPAAIEDTGSLARLNGQVDPGFIYRVQTTISDVAYAASVSLIDPTGTADGKPKTVVTTLTDEAGKFNFSLDKSFKPSSNRVYYLEAVKGLNSNMAGHDAARVRTLIQWKSGGWTSLTNASTGGTLIISLSTTALSVAAQLNTAEGKPVDLNDLIGKLSSGTIPYAYTPVANLSEAEYLEAFGVVEAALGGGTDPVASIEKANGNFVLKQVGESLGVTPGLGADIGDTVTISGMTFSVTPANNHVSFNGIPAQVTFVSGDRSWIRAIVPEAATRGPITISVGGQTSGVIDYPIFGTVRMTMTGIPGGSSTAGLTLRSSGDFLEHQSIATPSTTVSFSFKGLTPGHGWTVEASARNVPTGRPPQSNVWAQSTQIDGPFDPLTMTNAPIPGPYEVKSGLNVWNMGLRVPAITGNATDNR
ncbi:hypothetical protein D3C87_1055850 [compost metagenome]